MKRTWRDGGSKIIIPIVVVYHSQRLVIVTLVESPGKQMGDLLASSGLLKTPVPALGLAKLRVGLAGVPPPKRCGGPPASEPVDARNDDFESSRAWFHCLTSSTAWLKLAGAFDTCGSARRQLEIHA